MRHHSGIRRWLNATCLVAATMVACSGCQALHSSAIPGMSLDQGDRQLLSQAKQDPFPSPSDVGIKGNE